MQRNMQGLTDQPGESTGRTVLCVDPDDSYAGMLHDVWQQLHVAEELHIAHNQDEALDFIDSAQHRHRLPAAVVLDPDATGEQTGAFVRALRKHCGKKRVPIMFWSRDSEKYEVLEGRGVDSVLKKPMVLRLVQSLDAVCHLGVQHFNHNPGGGSFLHPILRLNGGARR